MDNHSHSRHFVASRFFRGGGRQPDSLATGHRSHRTHCSAGARATHLTPPGYDALDIACDRGLRGPTLPERVGFFCVCTPSRAPRRRSCSSTHSADSALVSRFGPYPVNEQDWALENRKRPLRHRKADFSAISKSLRMPFLITRRLRRYTGKGLFRAHLRHMPFC